MNSHSPEDRLLDELLREQAKGPDEDFLKQIEAAVDAGPPRKVKHPTPFGYGRIAIAASIGLVAGITASSFFLNHQSKPALAATEKNPAEELAARQAKNQSIAYELNKAIRDQEDKVEERRKVLTSIARIKTVVASNNQNEGSIKRGLDAQDYEDAKKDFESDTELLSAMKLKQVELRVAAASDPSSSVPSAPLAETSNLAANEVRPRTLLAPPAEGEGLGLGGSLAMKQPSAVAPNENQHPTEPTSADRYGRFIDQPWKSPARDPLSTFSIDVDTASYSNVRRMIQEGREIPRDAVRIEECINAFSYHYQQPKGDAPFSVSAALAACPWAPTHQLVRVAIQGREIDKNKRPPSNLVFLVDVSGSMQSSDKLPLLKQSMSTLVEQLDDRDRVAIVVYAGSEGVVLPSTRLDSEGRATVLKSLASLEAGGSTNGGAGIKRAYELAMKEKIDGGVNRVILASDGDFNVGVTGQQELVELVKERAQGGIYLTVLGFGTGNLNDAMMDAITRDGNGNYFYIDSPREGRKVFLEKLSGTLVTIAKDVKIQVEFNPAKVGSYRLIGYSNRVLQNEDFSNDKVDAGDIGAGHSVTAFYELTPPGAASNIEGLRYQPAPAKTEATAEWLTVKLRHKHPDGNESRLIEFALTSEPLVLDKTGADFQFATAAALFGMKLRGMDEVNDIGWEKVLELAKPGLAEDSSEDRAEFIELVKKLTANSQRSAPAAEVVPNNDETKAK